MVLNPPLNIQIHITWGALSQEKDIAVQQSALSNKIYAQLHANAISSKSNNSEASLLFNCTTLGIVLGMRVSKFFQTSPKKIYHHVYPSGTKVIKAFVANNFVFLDSSRDIITDLDDSLAPHKVKIMWRIQKNRQHGQSIPVSTNKDHPQLCPVHAALQMVLRS